MSLDPDNEQPKPAPSEPRPVSPWVVALGVVILLLLASAVAYTNWSILSAEV